MNHELDNFEYTLTRKELRSIKAEAWDEGANAGLDKGLDVAELVWSGHGILDLYKVPSPPVNPYRDVDS